MCDAPSLRGSPIHNQRAEWDVKIERGSEGSKVAEGNKVAGHSHDWRAS